MICPPPPRNAPEFHPKLCPVDSAFCILAKSALSGSVLHMQMTRNCRHMEHVSYIFSVRCASSDRLSQYRVADAEHSFDLRRVQVPSSFKVACPCPMEVNSHQIVHQTQGSELALTRWLLCTVRPLHVLTHHTQPLMKSDCSLQSRRKERERGKKRGNRGISAIPWFDHASKERRLPPASTVRFQTETSRKE